MNAPFVRPHSETPHSDGDGVRALGVGGLYGMDTESINEDWDTDWDTEPLEHQQSNPRKPTKLE